MFRPQLPPGRSRQGVILLVVLALLTLFSVIGLSFVLYANAQSTSARLAGEAQTLGRPDVESELLLAYFLGQLIYDVPDDESGVYSALRGHSLARSMFGYNDAVPNDVPYNGTGRLRTGEGTFQNPWQIDDYDLVNYTFFPADDFVRDPERRGRTGNDPDPLRRPRGEFVGGFNAPYTYPDANNMFLAGVRSDGTLLVPSFFRSYTSTDRGFGPMGTYDASGKFIPSRNWFDAADVPALKYMTLRPRPAEHPGFPPPADVGGDVKNLVGGPGGNDSIWLDLGFPVLKAPNGRKFKPLFAPLIIDLDNRINLNVHGNVRGRSAGGSLAHASNQGWGPWEVNVSRVLRRGDEWANLFTGSTRPAQPGRYGATTRPGSGDEARPPMTPPPFYAQVDFDGHHERAASGRIQLPGDGAPALSCFPYFNLPPYRLPLPPETLRGYGHAPPRLPDQERLERVGHPLLYNVFRPSGRDRVFALSNMEALLRYGDTGSPALTSELFRLCPTNLADAPTRRLVTTYSFDVDRPGVSPWAWQGVPAELYMLRQGPDDPPYPSGGALGFPTLANPPGSESEFTADWRARSASLGRLDLNRPLPRYPVPTGSDTITDLVGFRVAQTARQQLAQDIFERLWRVTGAADPAMIPGEFGQQADQFNALRWLAQLAVNVVDFLDPDDYMTPFNWTQNEWVFGTELPRLVLNEAYVELLPGGGENWDGKVWTELHNPLFTDATLLDSGAARLRGVFNNQPYGIYKIVITTAGENPDDDILRRPDNVRGDPDPGALLGGTDFTDAPLTLDRVEPANGQDRLGFYVVGPEALTLGSVIGPTYETPRLRYEASDNPRPPALLLRRLACPLLPPNPRVVGSFTIWNQDLPYNPYITVDYLDQVPRYHPTDAQRASWGRKQPYAAAARARQVPHDDTGPHTFFRPNEPRDTPFQWLAHRDRPLVSPLELLHVSAFKSHELTQYFMTGNQPEQRFRHRAPWFVPAARIYRVLEFLATRPRAAGFEPVTLNAEAGAGPGSNQLVPLSPTNGHTPSGVPWSIRPGDVLVIDPDTEHQENVRVTAVGTGSFTAAFLKSHLAGFKIELTTLGDRVPGRVNINTIWDEETFQALCDAQPANGFSDDPQVKDMFQQMIRRRTRDLDGRPGPADRPFRGLAAGFVPSNDAQHRDGLGVNDTLLRSVDQDGGPNTQRLFQVPGASHPHPQFELMTKVFNHLTTRSNVFAVWLTVGFFEVADESARPVRLGPEIGQAENRHVRHRMFAIVDRSVLTHHPGPQPRFDPRADSPGTSPGAPPETRKVVPYFSIID